MRGEFTIPGVVEVDWQVQLPWPEAGEKLFRDDLPDWKHNACFMSHGRWHAYSESYLQAGRALVREVSERKGLVDLLVYPIAFCYRQYLELAMKSLILTGSRLLDDAGTVLEGHRLGPLWDACREILLRVDPNCGKDLDAIEEKILQFEELDPSGMAFRYPVATKKEGRRPLLPAHLERFNVRHFAEQLEQVGGFFSAAGDEIAAHEEWKREMNEWYSGY